MTWPEPSDIYFVEVACKKTHPPQFVDRAPFLSPTPALPVAAMRHDLSGTPAEVTPGSHRDERRSVLTLDLTTPVDFRRQPWSSPFEDLAFGVKD